MLLEIGSNNFNRLIAYVKEAGQLAYQMRMDPASFSEIKVKADKSLVSIVDPIIEEYLKTRLLSLFGGRFRGEESGLSGEAEEELEWIVDPIDGTTNYTRGTDEGGFPSSPAWCLSVGLRQNGVPVLGVIYIPDTDQIYYAVKGSGAYAEVEKSGQIYKRKLQLPEQYSGNRVNMGIGIVEGTTLNNAALAIYEGFKKAVAGKTSSSTSRTLGATAIDSINVATGVFSAHVSAAALHDIAAAEVIISEAGGKVSILYPERDKFYFVASHPQIHDQMVAVVKASLEKNNLVTKKSEDNKMTDYQIIDGKRTAIINIIVDPQNGFHDWLLKMISGGNLYVPGGEEVIAPIGKLIANTKNGIFVISNDWHPKDHIADMNNHPGVVEYRKALLLTTEQDPEQYQNPVVLPFSEAVLDKNGYIIGIKDGDKIRKVDLKTADGQPASPKDRGRIVKVHDEYLEQNFSNIVGARTLYLWSTHCVQGTESARMPSGLNLPQSLINKLDNDLTKIVTFYHDAETGNKFFVVRKGTNSEVDSNGLYVENDKTTLTRAQEVFQQLAQEFIKEDVENVIINFTGLATNFCVEFSCNQVAAIGSGFFKVAGMQVQHNLIPEACRGIPIPGGKDDAFSLEGTLPRLQEKFGFSETTIENIISMQTGKPLNETSGELTARGNDILQQVA